MKHPATQYKRHRFPPEIIQYAVWLYFRFNLSHRDIEDLLAERGVAVTHESIRLWCNKFGPWYAHRRRRGNPARHPSVREQSGRVVASADPGTSAGDEAVQIPVSGATIRPRPRHRLEPLQPRPPPDRSGSLPDAASRRLCVMGQGSGGLTAIQQGNCGRGVNLAIPVNPFADPAGQCRIRVREAIHNDEQYRSARGLQGVPACPDKHFYRQGDQMNGHGALVYGHRAIEPTLVSFNSKLGICYRRNLHCHA